MKNINLLGFFDVRFLLEKLTKLKAPLVEFYDNIDRKIFALILDVVFNKPKNSNRVSSPPFDRIMMFKLLILQELGTLKPLN